VELHHVYLTAPEAGTTAKPAADKEMAMAALTATLAAAAEVMVPPEMSGSM